jgi:type VI secretion system protein ImpL
LTFKTKQIWEIGLIAVAIVAVCLIVGGMATVNWRWWVGLCCLLAVLGICAGAFLLKKLLQRLDVSRVVQQVAEHKENQMEPLPGREPNRLQDLQDCWEQAVQTLRHSHLAKLGNPLYVLPWYLVIGESGSGKSTAIKSARLSSPFIEPNHDHGVSITDNCHWSFLDNGILIDTAGRYCKPLNEEVDNHEWQKLLALLVKYRKRAAINGLIVTVSADKLLNNSPQELENDGRQIRCRIDELMRVLGVRFPVYVLVTKCDLMPGMVEFSRRLPEKSLDQPMGMVNDDLSEDVVALLERFTAGVADRLRILRLLLLHKAEPHQTDRGVLLFPDQLQHLQPGLAAYIGAAFHQNRYQDTPLLRGIYLGSGRQQDPIGPTFPEEMKPATLKDEDVVSACSRGLFLHDFFETILPGDLTVLRPTTGSMQWNRLTRNLGVVSWVLIGSALCGLLSYSFLKNMTTIRHASVAMAGMPVSSGNSITESAAMDGFRKMIDDVEQRNLDWWIPRFGLNESKDLEKALKARYCRQFRDRFLSSYDRKMATAVSSMTAVTPGDSYGIHVMHLCRRINLLKARLGGARPGLLKSQPLPLSVLPSLQGIQDPDGAGSFGSMYLNYVVWRAEDKEIEKEMQFLQSLLKQLLLVKGEKLLWVVEFTNRQLPDAAITLQSFWGGSLTSKAEPIIPPAFTSKGREFVRALIKEIAAAYPEPGVQELEKGAFESWYRSSCFAAWQRFAVLLPKGEERLNGAREWQNAAHIMASEEGPYFAFMKRAVAELQPLGVVEAAPPWLSQLYKYQALKAAGPTAGLAASAAEGGKRVAAKVGRLIGKEGAGAIAFESAGGAAKAAQDYHAALAQIAPVAKSRTLAHQMALQFFSEDTSADKSPFHQAADAAQRLSSLAAPGRADETFSRLISGPIAFYGTFTRQETACSLQRQWEEKVLKEVQGTADTQTLQYLLSKEGPVWKFVNTYADPFIGWNPKRGYYAKSALGGSVPFEPGFYSFLTSGAKAKISAAAPLKQSYNLTIKGLPTDANSEARRKPQRTRLELQCAAGTQVIDNMNYPVTKTFIWSPETCGDVLFQVEIGDLTLVKRYPGPNGFPDFLQDFAGGRHTFYPPKFPQEKQALERMGVRYIRANYQLFGSREIMSGQNTKSLPSRVPARITRCWE